MEPVVYRPGLRQEMNADWGRASEVAVQRQQDHCADQGHEKTRRMARGIDAERSTDDAADPGPNDSEEHCRDQAARMLAGHEKLGYYSHHQAE